MDRKKAQDRHQQKTVSFRLPEKLMAQLRLLARRNRRTLSGEAELAFEAHLKSNGLTPSDEASAERQDSAKGKS